MEIMKEDVPTSWEDFSLDWSNPDPSNYRYFFAIREAIVERALAVGVKLTRYLLDITPYNPMRVTTFYDFNRMLEDLSSQYLDMTQDDLKSVRDDFLSRKLTFNIFTPFEGEIIHEAKEWLIKSKELLQKMRFATISNNTSVYKKDGYRTRYASNGFDEIGRKYTAEELYEISTQEANESWANSEWEVPYTHSYWEFVMTSEYVEYYPSAFGDANWQKNSLYWASLSCENRHCNYELNLHDDYMPKIYYYGKLGQPSAWGGLTAKKFFNSSQPFPNDEAVVGKCCLLTNYELKEKTLDFRKACIDKMEIPPHSEMDYSFDNSETEYNGAPYIHIYCRVLSGFGVLNSQIIGDFYENFKFK